MMEQWQRQMREAKDAERKRKTEAAEVLQNYRGGVKEDELKLSALRKAEREKQLEAAETLKSYRGGVKEDELKLSALRKLEREKQQEAAEGLHVYRGGVKEDELKLSALRKTERERQLEAAQNLHSYRNVEPIESKPKPVRQELNIIPDVITPVSMKETIAITPGSVSAMAANFNRSSTSMSESGNDQHISTKSPNHDSIRDFSNVSIDIKDLTNNNDVVEDSVQESPKVSIDNLVEKFNVQPQQSDNGNANSLVGVPIQTSHTPRNEDESNDELEKLKINGQNENTTKENTEETDVALAVDGLANDESDKEAIEIVTKEPEVKIIDKPLEGNSKETTESFSITAPEIPAAVETNVFNSFDLNSDSRNPAIAEDNDGIPLIEAVGPDASSTSEDLKTNLVVAHDDELTDNPAVEETVLSENVNESATENKQTTDVEHVANTKPVTDSIEVTESTPTMEEPAKSQTTDTDDMVNASFQQSTDRLDIKDAHVDPAIVAPTDRSDGNVIAKSSSEDKKEYNIDSVKMEAPSVDLPNLNQVALSDSVIESPTKSDIESPVRSKKQTVSQNFVTTPTNSSPKRFNKSPLKSPTTSPVKSKSKEVQMHTIPLTKDDAVKLLKNMSRSSQKMLKRQEIDKNEVEEASDPFKPRHSDSRRIEFDILFSFGLVTSSDKPTFDRYMSAVDTVMRSILNSDKALRKMIKYNPRHGPRVREYSFDDEYKDPAGRSHVKRVLCIAAVPVVVYDDLIIPAARDRIIEGLQHSVRTGRFMTLAQHAKYK